jgi:hypothetical protein
MLAITHVDHRPPWPDDRIATMGRSYASRAPCSASRFRSSER